MKKEKPSVTVAAIQAIPRGTSKEFLVRDVKELYSARTTLYYVRSISLGDGRIFRGETDKSKPSITVYVD